MNKNIISNLFFIVLLSTLSHVTGQQQPQCQADIYLNSYFLGNGPRFNYIYHDIMVNNTGRCAITSVYVSVEFPPPSQNSPSSFIRAEQMNITTGELQGYGGIIPPYTMKQGGRIVWDARDIRAPYVTLASLSCSCPPTVSSTSAPTPSPTFTPTSAPTTRPTSTPTSTPTAPSTPTQTIVVAQHKDSNAWWFSLAVSQSQQAISKIEFIDSSVSSQYSSMFLTNYGYWTYTPSKAIALPVTLRITSTTGNSITLPSIISSFGSTVDSHTQFASVKSSRSVDQVDDAMMTSSTSTIHARVHEGSTAWWLGLEVSGNSEPIQSVAVKDNQQIQTYQTMSNTTWKYTVRQSIITPISSPFSVQLISVSGKVVEFTISSLAVGKDIDSGMQF